MKLKTVSVVIPRIHLDMFEAMCELYEEGKEINPNSVSKKVNCTWKFSKKQFEKKFNIKEIK